MKPLMVEDGLLLGVEPLVGRKPEMLQYLTAECIDVRVRLCLCKAQATASVSFTANVTGQKGCEVNGTLYQVGTSGAQASQPAGTELPIWGSPPALWSVAGGLRS